MVLRRLDPLKRYAADAGGHGPHVARRLSRNRGIPAVARTWSGGPYPWTSPKRGTMILVEASLPGIKPEDIDITIEDNLLTIKGATKAH